MPMIEARMIPVDMKVTELDVVFVASKASSAVYLAWYTILK